MDPMDPWMMHHPRSARIHGVMQHHARIARMMLHHSAGAVFPEDVGLMPTTSGNTYADRTTPGNETNIHVACRAGLDQNRIPPPSTVELLEGPTTIKRVLNLC